MREMLERVGWWIVVAFMAIAGSGCLIERDSYEIDLPLTILDPGSDADGEVFALLYTTMSKNCPDAEPGGATCHETPLGYLAYECEILDSATVDESGQVELFGSMLEVPECCMYSVSVGVFKEQPGQGEHSLEALLSWYAVELGDPYIRSDPLELTLDDAGLAELVAAGYEYDIYPPSVSYNQYEVLDRDDLALFQCIVEAL